MKIETYKNNTLVQSFQLERLTFPDSQPHIKIPENVALDDLTTIVITCSIRNPQELFELQMLVGMFINPWKYQIKLNILWLFGARMDRPIDDRQPNTFRTVCNNINLLGLQGNINLLDIHNPKAVTFGHREISLTPFLLEVLKDFGMDTDFYFPDAGAQERYKGLVGQSFNVLTGKKKRDSQTGKLSGFEIGSGLKQSDNIIIWDDLCDAGGTFIGQYNVLKELGYRRIGLYTAHGLYTKGLQPLSMFDAIWSTNSFQYDGTTDLKLIKHK
jgi:ribose-phosphate pyrophosphokinase